MTINRSDDHGNLELTAEKTTEATGSGTLAVPADKGYYDGQDIAACEAKGVGCLAAKPKAGGSCKKEKAFSHESFIYSHIN